MKRLCILLFGSFASLLGGCGAGDGADGEESALAIVSGQDNRKDVFEHPDARLRELAQRSSVALIFPDKLDESDPSNIKVIAPSLIDGENKVCPDEKFARQPTPSSCSGTLIGDDLVVTAGHCFRGRQCDGMRIVFGYYMKADGQLNTITKDDVFTCASVVGKNTTAEEDTVDYAVAKLDRKATPRFRPVAKIRRDFALRLGTELVVIGTPSGLPLKIDSGGKVRSIASAPDFFKADLDTFGNNSGSGVFDLQTLTLTGLLVRGAGEDYVREDKIPANVKKKTGRKCFVTNRCSMTSCLDGEEPDPTGTQECTFVGNVKPLAAR